MAVKHKMVKERRLKCPDCGETRAPIEGSNRMPSHTPYTMKTPCPASGNKEGTVVYMEVDYIGF
jgi:rRNA maturation protein Nop10